MPETRTEREKLVEAMKRRALARIDPVLRPDHDCREREPDLPGSWCSWCMVLAAADLLSEEGEPSIEWGHIDSIIADGYDVGEDSEAIARAVHAYVTEGEANPFKEEADRLHDRLIREGIR